LSEIPLSRQSAWQRWELASLEHDSVPRVDPETAARLESEREAAAIAAQVRAEAQAQGYAAGLAAAREENERLAALIATLSGDAARYEQRIADEVLDLAIALARQIAGDALNVRRETVLPIVVGALRQLPHGTQRVELRLHPTDIALVRDRLTHEADGPRITFVPDASILPGGCLIDCAQANLDATLPTRWRRLVAALGRTDDWLEPA